jgi:hypothetical protein
VPGHPSWCSGCRRPSTRARASRSPFSFAGMAAVGNDEAGIGYDGGAGSRGEEHAFVVRRERASQAQPERVDGAHAASRRSTLSTSPGSGATASVSLRLSSTDTAVDVRPTADLGHKAKTYSGWARTIVRTTTPSSLPARISAGQSHHPEVAPHRPHTSEPLRHAQAQPRRSSRPRASRQLSLYRRWGQRMPRWTDTSTPGPRLLRTDLGPPSTPTPPSQDQPICRRSGWTTCAARILRCAPGEFALVAVLGRGCELHGFIVSVSTNSAGVGGQCAGGVTAATSAERGGRPPMRFRAYTPNVYSVDPFRPVSVTVDLFVVSSRVSVAPFTATTR